MSSSDERSQLRDEMAMAALVGMIASGLKPDTSNTMLALAAYKMADAMLAAREEGSR